MTSAQRLHTTDPAGARASRDSISPSRGQRRTTRGCGRAETPAPTHWSMPKIGGFAVVAAPPNCEHARCVNMALEPRTPENLRSERWPKSLLYGHGQSESVTLGKSRHIFSKFRRVFGHPLRCSARGCYGRSRHRLCGSMTGMALSHCFDNKTSGSSAECSWDPSIPVFQDVPASDALETQAIMVGRCLGRDDRRSTLPVRHHQAVIEDASAVWFVGVESPRG